ncbi:MAG: 50S ribosomal protein L29 [Bacteroidales bacterium]|nr:50S ribosomal protein L29 [Bacteroidales bacterium]
MEQKVIRELTDDELRERLDEQQKQLNKLKLNHAVSPLENPHKIKEYRKIIARLKTELRQRELKEQLNNQ